ncbi:MAG TPA: hypothetical protein VM577_10045 [Anaerovoracaceae bacterium]|nr:hypothetical protein [Anaerovoracaceae bacterium]
MSINASVDLVVEYTVFYLSFLCCDLVAAWCLSDETLHCMR